MAKNQPYWTRPCWKCGAYERDGILNALAKAGGNHSRAAALFGMKRTTFLEAMRRVGVRLNPANPEAVYRQRAARDIRSRA